MQTIKLKLEQVKAC